MTIANYTTYVFKTICFVIVAVSICHLIARWFRNHDRSSIGFKEYNDSPSDRYPTFSFCVHSTGNGVLYDYFSDELMYKYHIAHETYELLLRGEEGTQRVQYMDFRNISHIDVKNYTLKLIDVVQSMKFKTNDANQSLEYNKYDGNMPDEEDPDWPFYIGHLDPTTLCYTRKSAFVADVRRKDDFVLFMLPKLREWNKYLYFRVYIHHPGQLTRVFDKPIFNSILDTVNRQNNHLIFSLAQVTVLRKRFNAMIPCDPDLEDDELKLKLQIMKRAGCTPNYWMSLIPNKYLMKECSTSSEMAKVFEDITNMKKVFKTYKQPCDEMKVVTSLQRQPYGYSGEAYMYVEFFYMDENYQEIVNQRDFTLAGFWSSTGGFVGMILGYSLMQLPDVVGRIWEWFYGRKKHERNK